MSHCLLPSRSACLLSFRVLVDFGSFFLFLWRANFPSIIFFSFILFRFVLSSIRPNNNLIKAAFFYCNKRTKYFTIIMFDTKLYCHIPFVDYMYRWWHVFSVDISFATIQYLPRRTYNIHNCIRMCLSANEESHFIDLN